MTQMKKIINTLRRINKQHDREKLIILLKSIIHSFTPAHGFM